MIDTLSELLVIAVREDAERTVPIAAAPLPCAVDMLADECTAPTLHVGARKALGASAITDALVRTRAMTRVVTGVLLGVTLNVVMPAMTALEFTMSKALKELLDFR